MLIAVSATAQTVDVIASQDHYFISSLQPDINALDSGHFPGWARTGLTFKAYPAATANASPVCRFYIPPADGDSHFYSASPVECTAVQARFPAFILESPNVMYIDLPDPTTGACPAGDVPVYRVGDNRTDTNHRYTTDLAIRAQMITKGWVAEGYGPNQVIMCAPPPAAADVIVNFVTTTTPLNPGFNGFNNNLKNAVEYYDSSFQQILTTLSPGWLRFPGGTDSEAFDWASGELCRRGSTLWRRTHTNTISMQRLNQSSRARVARRSATSRTWLPTSVARK
jgi:hypothetical protein